MEALTCDGCEGEYIICYLVDQSVGRLVQSLNSPFFPPHIGVQPLYGAGRKESSGTGLLGAMIARLNNRSRIAAFVEKKHILVKLLATKMTKSKKMRIRNGILDM